MDKVPTIIVDRSVWRNAITLDDYELSLKAIRWGNLFLLRWVGRNIKKPVSQPNRIDTYANLHPIIEAAKKGRVKLLCTDIIRHEIGFDGFCNIRDLVLKDSKLLTFVGPEAKFPPDYKTEYEGDEKGGIMRFYGTLPNTTNQDRRKDYVRQYKNIEWQKVRAQSENHIVDAFIHWVAHTSKVDFVLTADTKFINFSRQDSKLRNLTPIQITTHQLNTKLQLGEPDEKWIYGVRNIFRQQRMFDAGTIVLAGGKFGLLKAAILGKITYNPPTDLSFKPSKREVKQALIKYYLDK